MAIQLHIQQHFNIQRILQALQPKFFRRPPVSAFPQRSPLNLHERGFSNDSATVNQSRQTKHLQTSARYAATSSRNCLGIILGITLLGFAIVIVGCDLYRRLYLSEEQRINEAEERSERSRRVDEYLKRHEDELVNNYLVRD